ncbi:MAG: hypothetical protein D6734_06915 [Candidatus Schekmanbacteria bacterium]|nr:MAG: hypothetical protein D6734_06915 [Candidatus Schekmanbacteria bacterium]
MDENAVKSSSRPLPITIIAILFIVWGLMVFADFTGIMTPKMDGKAVNVILGFRIFGIYAKIMDAIQLTLIVLMIYGLFTMKKLFGFFLTFAYMVYAVVSTHSWALMAGTEVSKRAKLSYDIFGIIAAGIICIILYINKEKFS